MQLERPESTEWITGMVMIRLVTVAMEAQGRLDLLDQEGKMVATAVTLSWR